METSRFVVIREDLNVDPLELVTDGLKIGRLPSCEVVLNYPTVSRLHAGINEAGGRFYFYNFSQSSGTTLNGRVVTVDQAEVVADGDIIQIGPFFLYIERVGDALSIRVSLQMAASISDQEVVAGAQPEEEREDGDEVEVSQALNVFWEKRKREAGKMQRLSPLRPHAPSRTVGKVRFNWTPTRDLVRPWPFSVFIWAFLIVGVLSAIAAYAYTNAFSPAPLSNAHDRQNFKAQPAIAREVNAGSCTNCHTLTGSMDSNCTSCHTTATFAFAVTKEHADAGIGCTACHVEHQGTEFRPQIASLQTCTTCHNDANKATYNGKSVSTPHGGTIGYPIINGKWMWRGLSDEEWQAKPVLMRERLPKMEQSAQRWPVAGDANDRRRSAEFHLLHVYRVKAVRGLKGDKDGLLTCSSCHNDWVKVDRETPRTTCATCHAGDTDGKFESVLAPDKAHCDSCHVQHAKGPRTWGVDMLISK